MAGIARVSVEGLANLNRSLRQLDSEAPKALRLALNASADELVRKIKAQIPTRKGKAKGSIKTASTRTEVRIRFGGPRAPYYPWLDFGGRVGRQKKTVRPFYREGRYIYPTIRRERGAFQQSLQDALSDLLSNVGLDED